MKIIESADEVKQILRKYLVGNKLKIVGSRLPEFFSVIERSDGTGNVKYRGVNYSYIIDGDDIKVTEIGGKEFAPSEVITKYALSHITEEGAEGDFLAEYDDLNIAIKIAKQVSKEEDVPLEIVKYTFVEVGDFEEEDVEDPVVVWDNFDTYLKKYPEIYSNI